MQQVNTLIDTKLPQLKQFIPALKTLNIQGNAGTIFSYYALELTGPDTFDHFINKLFSVGDNKDAQEKYHFARTITAYRMVAVHKDSLIAPIMALAQLDMYLSLARLHTKSNAANKPMCFANLVTHSDNPVFELQGVWNPMVQGSPVPNDFALGTPSVNYLRNALITGPNTGGKSTLTRALFFAALMAQACGMVPATSCEMTPFSNMRAYVNIKDNPAEGLSLFKASIVRAADLIKKGADKHGHSFIFFDEMYNGTNPQGGESLAYATLKEFATSQDFKKALCLSTTHYQCVHALAENPEVRLAYHRVARPDDEENKFKILPGIYDEFNGFDIAQDTQMNSNVLDSARAYHEENFRNDTRYSYLLDMLEVRGFSNFKLYILQHKHKKKYLKDFMRLLLKSQDVERFFEFVAINQDNDDGLAKLLNIQDDLGRTVLHLAALWDIKKAELLEQLIYLGANSELSDNYDQLPLDYAYDGSVAQKVLLNAHNLPKKTPVSLKDELCKAATQNQSSCSSGSSFIPDTDDEVQEIAEAKPDLAVNSLDAQVSVYLEQIAEHENIDTIDNLAEQAIEQLELQADEYRKEIADNETIDTEEKFILVRNYMTDLMERIDKIRHAAYEKKQKDEGNL